jgi:hypothetical protein
MTLRLTHHRIIKHESVFKFYKIRGVLHIQLTADLQYANRKKTRANSYINRTAGDGGRVTLYNQ